MVKENTEDWTWDGLLRDVARDFQEEAERNQKMTEKRKLRLRRSSLQYEDTGTTQEAGQGRAAAAPKPKKEEGKEDKGDAPSMLDTWNSTRPSARRRRREGRAAR